MPDCVALAIDGATASVALAGAEPRSWRVGGRELLWHGDPAHWGERAPILFPVVGASAGGMVRIGGENYRCRGTASPARCRLGSPSRAQTVRG